MLRELQAVPRRAEFGPLFLPLSRLDLLFSAEHTPQLATAGTVCRLCAKFLFVRAPSKLCLTAAVDRTTHVEEREKKYEEKEKG